MKVRISDSKRKINNIHIPFKNEKELFLKPEILKHLKALRVKENETLQIFSGDGKIGYAYLKKDRVELYEVRSIKEKPYIDVYLPLLKNDAHRFIMRNMTSFPIRNIYLLTTELSTLKREWKTSDENLLKEGMIQSENPFLPVLMPTKKIEDVKIIKNTDHYFGSIFFGSKISRKNNDISVLTGPEGGFNFEEEKKMIDIGIIPVNISPFILRSEIAIFSLISKLISH